MIRRPPRSTHCISSAASDVYKRQVFITAGGIYLLLFWDSSKTLPTVMTKVGEYFSLFSYIARYEFYYFKLNALMFVLSGIFTIMGYWHSFLFQALGSAMYVLTYDNPLLPGYLFSRIIYFQCHLIVVLTLFVLRNNKSTAIDKSKLKTE
eukprot:TRINITY_DN2223_c0_g1_i5.p1 TRINITY_DN2223_c0_g1~~TRINITY_DN2223_c0_g1_i5.p1  ORF type:complete len:157 (+),score=40.84 TRINITY_DN2223_c0_g1_i5:23-472(+)